MRSPITTHILDTNLGKPAVNVACVLFRKENNQWSQIASGKTNSDGRIVDWMEETERQAGIYRIEFDTDGYFDVLGQHCFYPSVSIDFRIVAINEHYHVPLLLTAFGFSTYRGS